MEGMEATTDLFINLIQNNRIIYDKSMKEFKNTRKKEEVWQNIANQSRMTVDNAKKRYASLRQKYSREKRSSELKRRYKTAVSRNWVFYERLNFLDSFIQPRSTYTNDKFDENDDDTEMLNEFGTEETNGGDSNAVEIEIEAGIGVDELGGLATDDGLNTCVQLDTTQHEQSDIDQQQTDGNIFNCHERIASEYSRNESTFHHHQSSVVLRTISRDDRNDTNIGDTAAQPSSENVEQIVGANVVDMDSYMSPHPGTSSSTGNITVPPYASRCYDPKTGEIIQMTSNDVPNSSQRQQSSSIQKNTTTSTQHPAASSAATTIRSSQSARSSTIAPNIARVAQLTSTSASKNEKRIDEIRQRMESCLTAITNKVTDKAQKSPHGPFLSYLGTRLPSVPKERLPKLEREILDLVEQYVP
ncbi:uncharacterized protein LOC119081133 [Bradysia coprophila]|uniref:uncharacterized protein LOC119081133 n=1 Tax=Bradysia coprophila TaxID=38358 RepID=UPI00187D744C|nr:uncharacterized protein LOC119081133 [Bradysia coprophila]